MSSRKRKDPGSGTDDRDRSPPSKLLRTEVDSPGKTRLLLGPKVDSANRSGPVLYTLPSAVSSSEQPPAFGQPQQLICFSYTPQREILFDTSALKFYVPAPLNADLGYRYEHWIKRPEEKGRLDNLLRAIEQESAAGERKKGAFVTWRGVMTKLMITPFETRDAVELNLMLLDGCIYAEEHSDDAKLAEKEAMNPHQRRMTYYGYSFESFSTWHEPVHNKEQHAQRDSVRCWGGDVDTNVQYCSVVKTKLGVERLILGGEVDCCRDRYTGQPNTYVELKTSMIIRNAQDEQRFERKLLKFWAQSFLLGVPEVVVGFRTPQGRLSTIQTFQTLGLPRLVRGKPDAWDPNTCLSFAAKLIQFVRTTLEADDREVGEDAKPQSSKAQEKSSAGTQPSVWRLRTQPNGGDTVLRKLSDEEIEAVRSGEERVGFLPTWFYKSVVG